MKNQKSQSGFTLIELLVVIAIIGLLSSMLVTAVAQARIKSRDTRRKADLAQVQKALELYYNGNNGYPDTSGAWRGLPTTGGNCGSAAYTVSGTNSYIPGFTPAYVGQLPTDPIAGAAQCYGYNYKSDGTNYKLISNIAPETYPASGQAFYDACRPTTGIMVTNNPPVTNNSGTCVSGGW